MDRSERQHEKEKRKKMRHQQKLFLAEERRSLRKEKHEMKLQRSFMKRRIRQARWNNFKQKFRQFFQHPFQSKLKVQNRLHDKKYKDKAYLPFNWDVKVTHTISDPREERLKRRERKKLIRKQQKEFLHEEKRSLKKERRQMKERMLVMRREIRSAQREGFKNEFKKFILHPFKRKTGEVDEIEKKIQKKIKREIRQQNLGEFYKIPKAVFNSISKYWKNRFKQWANFKRGTNSFFLLVKTAFKQPEYRKGYILTIINSLALFLLAFLLVYYVHQFTTIFTARAFNIPTKLYSYRIDWPLYTYSYLYSRRALIVIFGMGPLFCLLMGFGAYQLFLRVRFRTVFFKTFLLWIAFHSFNLFFGAYIVGVITRTGFVYTSEWLFLSNVFDVEEIVFMIVSIIILLIAGYYSTKQFLYASDSAVIIEPKYRILYLMSKVLIPWLSGTLVLFAVNIPKNPLELIMLYGTSSLIVIPIFSNYNSTIMNMVRLPNIPGRIKIGWVFILITILVIIATRLLLRSGINFS